MIMAKENNKTYDLVYISMFTVLIAICSWISIPAAVPFTLQTLGVFLASALVMWGMERAFGKGKKIQILSMLVGLLACYAVGTLWFMAVYTHQTGEVGILAVLGWCVFPFVIPDILKIALAVILSGRLKGAVRR